MVHITGKRQRVFSISICNVRLRYIKLEAKNTFGFGFFCGMKHFYYFSVSPPLVCILQCYFRCISVYFAVWFRVFSNPGSTFTKFFFVYETENFSPRLVAMQPCIQCFDSKHIPAQCSGTRQFMSLDGQFNSYKPENLQ